MGITHRWGRVRGRGRPIGITVDIESTLDEIVHIGGGEGAGYGHMTIYGYNASSHDHIWVYGMIGGAYRRRRRGRQDDGRLRVRV